MGGLHLSSTIFCNIFLLAWSLHLDTMASGVKFPRTLGNISPTLSYSFSISKMGIFTVTTWR